MQFSHVNLTAKHKAWEDCTHQVPGSNPRSGRQRVCTPSVIIRLQHRPVWADLMQEDLQLNPALQ